MVRSKHLILGMVAALCGTLAAIAHAQMPMAEPIQPAYELPAAGQPEPLPDLPQPPDRPDSLFQSAPMGQPYECSVMEEPYFQEDPLLDPIDLPHPGWLFDVELGIFGSSVSQTLGQTHPPGQITVPIPGSGLPDTVVIVPMARLDWTVSPRFELGYRLPSGFGEIDVAYRFLLAEGNGSTQDPNAAPDAPAALTSRLNLHVGDVDYASRETSLGPNWGMKWRIGLRIADIFFDARAEEPFAAAAAGSGVFERSISNHFWGIGPHATLELQRRRNAWGLGWTGRLDSGLLFGEVRQRFAATSTTPGPGGFLRGETDLSNPQQVPMLSGFLGLDWRCPRRPNLNVLLGYSAEYWWNVGRLSAPKYYQGQSAGEAGAHGALFRVQYNY